MPPPRVSLGIDRLLQALREGDNREVGTGSEDLHEIAARIRKGARCGVVTNPSAVTSNLADPIAVLHGAGAHITALFGPEHGARGAAAAGEKVGSSVDRLTGLPIYSLYGPTVRPTSEMLRDIDLLIYDLQDVGVRFFTYTWTLSYLIEAAAE